MATTTLGKVMVTQKGAWSSSTTYEILDVVSYNGSSFLAKQASTNVTPVEGAYWMLIAQKGNTGDSAGFGTPTATIDANVGTPSVEVTASGEATAKVFAFAFHNIKGEKGDTGDVAKSADSTVNFTVGCDSNGFYVTI